jgi:hypothetical protein
VTTHAGDGGGLPPLTPPAGNPSEADLFMAARDLPPEPLPESRSELLDYLRGQPRVRNGVTYVYRPRISYRRPAGAGRSVRPESGKAQKLTDATLPARADAPPRPHGGAGAVLWPLGIIGTLGVVAALVVALTAGGGRWYAAQATSAGTAGTWAPASSAASGVTGKETAAPIAQTAAPVAAAAPAPWSAAECDWALKTLALDARLDQQTAESAADASSRAYYAEWAGTWVTVGGLAAHTCGRSSPVGVDPASECPWAQERIETARQVHLAWADRGDHVDFNRAWSTAYAALGRLFARDCA